MTHYKETETQHAPGEGLGFGCLTGLGVSGCLITAGLLIGITGIGLIIGIPLIIAGIIAPFYTSFLGLAAQKGECPWCGSEVTSSLAGKAMTCPYCKNRIIIRDNKFIKVG